MTVNFYLDSNKLLKNPEKAIYCYIRGIKNNCTIKLRTGEYIRPEQWDEDSQRAIVKGPKRMPGATDLNDYLNSFSERIKKIYRQTSIDKPDITYDELVQIFKGKFREKGVSFFDEYDNYIEIKRTTVGFRTIQRLQTVKNHIQNYAKAKNLTVTFGSVDMYFLDGLRAYLLTNKTLANNTASKIIKHLKEFMTWAAKRNLHKNLEYQDFKLKWNESDMVVLEVDEFDKLMAHDFSKTPHLDRVRDVFCFGCMTGARYGDLAALRFTDITNNTWKLITEKTKQTLYVPIIPRAEKILKKYKADGKLPIISNQKMNIHLKDILKEIEVNQETKKKKFSGANTTEKTKAKYEMVTMHTARRTFVTLSLQKGMRPEVIMRITGHKDLRIFQKYIKINEGVQKREMLEAWE